MNPDGQRPHMDAVFTLHPYRVCIEYTLYINTSHALWITVHFRHFHLLAASSVYISRATCLLLSFSFLFALHFYLYYSLFSVVVILMYSSEMASIISLSHFLRHQFKALFCTKKTHPIVLPMRLRSFEIY